MLDFAAQNMKKVRFDGIATVETDPYRPIVIGNHGEITARRFFREFLSDQRSVEESMYPPAVSKPDISFPVHQLCHSIRVYVIGFGTRRGRCVWVISQALFWNAHHDGFACG